MSKAANDSQTSTTIENSTWRTESSKFIEFAGIGFGSVTAMLVFKRIPPLWSGLASGLAFGFSQSYADAHSIFR